MPVEQQWRKITYTLFIELFSHLRLAHCTYTYLPSKQMDNLKRKHLQLPPQDVRHELLSGIASTSITNPYMDFTLGGRLIMQNEKMRLRQCAIVQVWIFTSGFCSWKTASLCSFAPNPDMKKIKPKHFSFSFLNSIYIDKEKNRSVIFFGNLILLNSKMPLQ